MFLFAGLLSAGVGALALGNARFRENWAYALGLRTYDTRNPADLKALAHARGVESAMVVTVSRAGAATPRLVMFKDAKKNEVSFPAGKIEADDGWRPALNVNDLFLEQMDLPHLKIAVSVVWAVIAQSWTWKRSLALMPFRLFTIFFPLHTAVFMAAFVHGSFVFRLKDMQWVWTTQYHAANDCAERELREETNLGYHSGLNEHIVFTGEGKTATGMPVAIITQKLHGRNLAEFRSEEFSAYQEFDRIQQTGDKTAVAFTLAEPNETVPVRKFNVLSLAGIKTALGGIEMEESVQFA